MSTSRFTIDAGPHDRRHTPVSFPLPDGVTVGALRSADDDRPVPAQVHDGMVHLIVDRLKAGERRTYVFDSEARPVRRGGVWLAHDQAAGRVDIRVGRSAFTTYRYDPRCARPHFYPLLGPGGAAMTRHYPMRDDVPGEPHDHPHHRSLWVAFGDINGQDNWSEQDGHAWQAHQAMHEVVSGPVFGQFTQTLRWLDGDRRGAHLHERRTVRVWKTPDGARLMDLTVALTAEARDAVFGDTKEGGICSVRVATTMDGSKGGRIENSFGGIGEAETWGKPAHWCDYSGPVAGKVVGIAVMDHPMNLRHPTPWHVRDYGLMGANPCRHAPYQSAPLRDGSCALPAGETLTFRYRVYLHSGDAKKGGVAARYADYVAGPKVERG